MKQLKYKIISGHYMCHPETCSCWDYKVVEIGKEHHPSMLCTDDYNEAKEYCDNLNEGNVLRWVKP